MKVPNVERVFDESVLVNFYAKNLMVQFDVREWVVNFIDKPIHQNKDVTIHRISWLVLTTSI